MIVINAASLERSGAEGMLSAMIEDASGPIKLWFRLPAEFASHLDPSLDAFVIAMLLHAMRTKQPIHARGALSLRLAHGLREYQRVFHSWFPADLHLVEITAEEYIERLPPAISGGTGAAFSGGVDSFYTLFCHLPERESLPQFAITHLVFIHGFDLPLHEHESFSVAAKAFRQLADELGMQFIPVATNIRELTSIVSWELTHGSALASVAHALCGLFRRFYVPASSVYKEDYGAWGSDCRFDHFLSGDSLEIIHDGSHASRMDKVLALANWPSTYGRLRVCWEKPTGLDNCGKCTKCIRTMIALEIAGVRDRFRTFPRDCDLVHLIRTQYEISLLERNEFTPDLMRLARNFGQTRITRALRTALLRSALKRRKQQAAQLMKRMVRPLVGAR